MKKHISLLLFIIFSVPLHAQQWHDDDAKFRLEVKPEKSNAILFIDLHAMIFPSSLKNGVTVYSAGGRKIPHRLNKETYALFTGFAPEKENLYIYFGYENMHPFDCWSEFELGKPPEIHKLRMKTSGARTDNTAEAEMLVNENYRKYMEIRKQESDAFRFEQDILAETKELEALAATGRTGDIEVLKKRISADKMDLEERKISIQNRTKAANIPAGELKRFKDKERESERNPRPGGPPPGGSETTTVKTAILDKTTSTKNRTFIGQFMGTLLITEPGIYSFAINSRDSSHLMIDDKLVVSWPYRHDKSENWEKTGEIFLDQGLHPLSYYFQKGKGEPPYAAVAWKKPGEKDFRILEEKDFSPAFRGSIISCSDKDGKKNPMVKYEINGHFFLGDDRKADWIDCEIDMAGNNFTPVWKVGGETFPGKSRVSLAPERKSDTPIILSSKEKSFTDISIEIPDELLKESDSRLIEQDITMRLAVPPFIFDDETLEMSVELQSALPVETSVQLKVSPVRSTPLFKEESSWIDIEPRKNVEADPYSQLFIWSRKFTLDGESLDAAGLQVKFTLAVPPLNISEENISFLPLADCPPLTYDPVGFYQDPQRKRIIPVLHRPTLSEKRRWSFIQAFVDELLPTGKILLIGDDFGENGNSFSKRLSKMLENESVSLEFAAWRKEKDAPAMAAGLGHMLKVIDETDADRIIIIPSVWDTDMGAPARLQLRILSAMVQAAQSNRKIRTIALATPYPSLAENPIGLEVAKGIRQEIVKDYAIGEIIDMDEFVRSRPDWRTSYRATSGSSVLLAPLPVGLTDEICRFIAGSD